MDIVVSEENDLKMEVPEQLTVAYYDAELRKAIKEKNNVCVEELLNQIKDAFELNVVDRLKLNALHKVTQKMIFSKSVDERSCYLERLRLFLLANASKSEKLIDINAQDVFGNTPLHFAALSGIEEAILELLRHGAHFGIKNVLDETAVKRINPSTLESYLDSCISLQEDPGTIKKFSIKFDYSVFAPPRAKNISGDDSECSKLCITSENCNRLNEEKVNPECEALWHLSTSKKHQHLLKHPLITSFLELKWRNIRSFYYTNLGFYSFSMLIITAYILLLHSGLEEDSITKPLNCLWGLSVFCVMILFVREIFQFGIAPCCYVFSLENVIELTMLINAMIVIFNWYVAANWRHLSAVVVLLAWVEELLLLGRLPRFAIFVTTFKTVFMSFLFLLFWYSTLFIGFGFSFFLVFGGGNNSTNTGVGAANETAVFATVPDSMLKVLPMMIGEFEFSSLPFGPNPFTSRIVFIAFVFLITIVLLNLLNGLAVSDTQEVKSKAEILCYVSRVELVSYIESILLGDPFEFLADLPPFSFIRRNCFIYGPILSFFRWAFINGFISPRRAMLFYDDYLPNKSLTVLPSGKINQVSSSLNRNDKRTICNCHDKFRLDKNIIDNAIQRAGSKDKEMSYQDVLAKIGELQAYITRLMNKDRSS